MKTLDHEALDALILRARESPRRRAHQTLHVELSDPVQRLAIAVEPDSYIRPHRHPQSWELLSRLRGRFAVLFFDDTGQVLSRNELDERHPVLEYPATTWHSLVALEPGSVFFEVKAGPYIAPAESDSAAWAPRENQPECASLLAWLRQARVGERYAG